MACYSLTRWSRVWRHVNGSLRRITAAAWVLPSDLWSELLERGLHRDSSIGNLGHGVAMHSLLYSFGRLHLRHCWSTPAQAAGETDHRWTIEEVVALLDSQRTGS